MDLKHTLAPLAAVLIWAGNTVVSKAAASVIDPATISFYRWLLAGILLALFFARPVWRQRREIKPYLPKLFVLGILGMVMYQCLIYIAAETTSATNMGILASLMPLMSVGISMIVLREKATVGVVCGGVLSLAGLVYLLSEGHPTVLLSQGIAVGDGLMLLACACYALYGVLIKYWAIPMNAWHSVLIQVWSVVPVLFIYYLSHFAPPLTAAGLPLVLYAGIPASMFAPFLWMYGVDKLGPTSASMMMNLLPLFTVVIAILFLGESLHVYHVIGGGIALLGVVFAQLLKPRAHLGAKVGA
jgi:drug/metabolite transporter (DMT)-like permease